MNTNDEFWKRKLMAFLHDPPCKCFNIREHEKIAESFRTKAGISESDYGAFRKDCDWMASAADRFPFPPIKCSAKFTGGEDFPFFHPMGGGKLSFPVPITTGELAEERFHKAIGSVDSGLDWKTKFFLYWRRWPSESAALDKRLAYLPADTRIPDHTIWAHMSLTSALMGCVTDGKLKPAFLIFQMGPVQEFIAQAKSTRDLWSGSYLISWLIACAIKAVTDEVGPDAVLFPSLRGQPIYDALHKEMLKSIRFRGRKGKIESLWERIYKADINEGMRRLLTPTIPNRFCALVPADRGEELTQKAESSIHQALEEIAQVCWEKIKEGKTEIDEERWRKQIKLFPRITWQIMDWRESPDLDENLKDLERIAKKSRDEDPGPGFYWSAQYALVEKAHAARRNTRDFPQYITDEHQDGSRKDILSGREEVIGKEDLGALNLIKREFAFTFLQPCLGFSKDQFRDAIRYDSTQDVSLKNKEADNSYIAVLALDGDKMGKWLSGELAPPLLDQLAPRAREYISSIFPEGKNEKDIRRHLSPSYQLQFSEALSNFALFLADRVVREFEGQLIYAGGDDVLAMLPSSRALECAEALRACFRGANIPKELRSSLNLHIDQDGFVNCGAGSPILVPGPRSDVSCGIAVGHCNHPLQALVREAREAEKTAKTKYDRGAFAVTLIKRSGETIHWGAKWDSAALALYKEFTAATDQGKLSGRFPYALAELLRPYNLEKDTVDDNFKEVIRKEYAHVLERQSLVRGTRLDRADDYLASLSPEYLSDFISVFLVSAFMNRQRGER